MQTQAMTNKIYTADRDRDFHFRVKDPGSAATHFIGFVAAVLMTPVLLVHAAGNGADFMTMIGMSVFMISMILLYGASTSYHSFDISEKANLRLKRLDHMMIFVLIAGSYTPVCLTVLRHGVGIRLLAIVWGLAIVGMIFKLLWVTCPKWVSSVIYIGMGQIEDGVNVGGTLAQPGDAIIVTGDVGRHGCTILLAREDFGIEANVTSDCAPLWKTVEAVMNTTHDLHVIRDATRGGVGTVLYEIAGQSNVGIRLDAASVPVAPEVKGVCGMLGLEPLYLACEGRMVIMAPKAEAEKIVETLRKCPYSKDAAIIGEVIDDQPGKVVMTTEIGTQALLPQPGGELLPRIC